MHNMRPINSPSILSWGIGNLSLQQSEQRKEEKRPPCRRQEFQEKKRKREIYFFFRKYNNKAATPREKHWISAREHFLSENPSYTQGWNAEPVSRQSVQSRYAPRGFSRCIRSGLLTTVIYSVPFSLWQGLKSSSFAGISRDDRTPRPPSL